ncbi:MAG: UDP-N-acetylmuramoyl-L-alanyl-D-glutamate--2,6-diaminopimelate ligase [Burkholderiales bacterium]|nr:UDP-N-acetylmuramoyl-L-alanyl-D-glutamate--2,6-diaminopimelate ligase [Burkholderiales bacterium]
MALRQLGSVDAALGWFAQRGVRALTTDSRRVSAGHAFIAWPGYAVDGRQFVANALASGAVACLVEAEGAEAFALEECAEVAALPGLKASTGALASGFMGSPSERLRVIAVTGTNGKTSTAWWVAQALSALGRRCGVVGTLGVGEPPSPGKAAEIEFTGLTTPDPVTLQMGFKRFVDAGFEACAIEASSIGVSEHRLAGTHIDVALFTNFTLDHLDYHGSMQAYWQAKAALFAWPGLKAAVLNIDDVQGATLATTLDASSLDVWTYSVAQPARLRASDVRYVDGGLSFVLQEGAAQVAVATRLIGDYNVSNLLAVIGGLRASGVTLADAARVCATLTPVPGRMQRVVAETSAGPEVVVDYAHTPDALEKALLALQPFAAQRGGQLWCVFGCGGNRDAGKRPLMGALAQRLAGRVVITSDNPRNEAPAFITLQIVAGLAGNQDRVTVVEERRAAIRYALREADARDVILIAGKGHEDCQEIRGVKLPFSDVAEASAGLVLRGAKA